MTSLQRWTKPAIVCQNLPHQESTHIPLPPTAFSCFIEGNYYSNGNRNSRDEPALNVDHIILLSGARVGT